MGRPADTSRAWCAPFIAECGAERRRESRAYTGDDGVTERLLTARDLGVLLGLSPATVLDRFERGDLPGFRLFGRKGGPVRFRESEILSALEGWRFGCIELAPECHR